MRFAGSDPDQKSLPSSAFSYKVVFHHNDHTHPFLADVAGKRSATVRIPNDGELATDVFYRVHLSVTDAKGVTTEVTRDVLPRLARASVTSNVVGQVVNFDSVPRATPFEVTGVVGVLRSVGYPREFELGGVAYRLVRGAKGRLVNGEVVFALAPRDSEIVLVYRVVRR